jgi:hypothetical protein
MAKRRDLKKTVEYLSGELMAETLFCSLQPEADRAKPGEIMVRICEMHNEYRRRIQNPPARADKQPARQYYRKLREDFNAEADRIYGELMLLNKEGTEN